ncbi:guanine nucleotide-binding protein subunit alpha [Scheffersomyces spartinae]|uniref:Guanine nucleotide-binding protein subunit alpha n=1 Tax=Scheffersomyces spartinae TaxID=45513 RepID=A0A9P7VA20_9ASCO|nr:guanine nucleotide-binding protein subunit alpha [Scheffersomyces spartinae]KAG7194112.1 guanine nucleotide-binding protein subunit alpha [Scheffersomyces spartinae]
MGCIVSSPDDFDNDPFSQDRLLNDAIDKELAKSKLRDRNQIKLLLLGAGESGKSTVLKQLKLLHTSGFTDGEKKQYTQVIWVDAIQSMKILLQQARKLHIPLDCDDVLSPLAIHRDILLVTDPFGQMDTSVVGGNDFLNEYVIRYSKNYRSERRLKSTGMASGFVEEQPQSLPPPKYSSSRSGGLLTPTCEEAKSRLFKALEADEISNAEIDDDDDDDDDDMHKYEQKTHYTRNDISEAITNLWKYDTGIKKCFERANEFQLETNASYYFDNIERFANPNYQCTDQDILHGRIKTTGITETNLSVKNYNIKVLDAGGQRSERKKWIHCFEDITAVVFVLAISEYDQVLFEDELVNRMHEAIVLFDSLCNSRWFANTPFVLFLNKIDLFEKKLAKSNLKDYFPEYTGTANDVDTAATFFEQGFLRLNRTKKPIYVHRTCATDTQSMKFILSAVTDIIITQNLEKNGLL